MFGGNQDTADKVSGSILSGAAVVGYILGEGLTDASAAKAANPNIGGEENEGN